MKMKDINLVLNYIKNWNSFRWKMWFER